MPDLRDLLLDELQDLGSAENQIVGALPQMVEAAHCSKLKESFQKHLVEELQSTDFVLFLSVLYRFLSLFEKTLHSFARF